MMTESVLIQNGTLVTESGERKADVLIEAGIIREITSHSPRTKSQGPNPKSEIKIIDASGLSILPGLIDAHVHFREPGLTHKGTMASEAASALAGGVTTVCEMPNTTPPCVTVEAFREKVRLTNKVSGIDIRLFFGITKKSHIEELRKLMQDSELRSRCCGVKLYLDHSTGDQKVDGGIIDDVFAVCKELDLTIVAHCEDADLNEAAKRTLQSASGVSAHSLLRPPESEVASVQFAIEKARKHGTRFHVAHLSTSGALGLVGVAKKEGLPVTCEVAPHHLFLSIDDYPRLGAFGKMNPPLRSAFHVAALWGGIADGTVDCIATDHAPHTLEEKSVQDPLSSPSGVPGVETMLPLLLEAAAAKRLTVTDIVRLCFTNPNRIFGLGKKGIVEGAEADILLVDPQKPWTIRGKELRSKCAWTPFEGREVVGKVMNIIRT